jgi:hypothetical protein
MNLRTRLEKKIQTKVAEIADAEAYIREETAYLRGLEDALALLDGKDEQQVSEQPHVEVETVSTHKPTVRTERAATDDSPNPPCPYCGGASSKKGTRATGEQKWICKDAKACGRYFDEITLSRPVDPCACGRPANHNGVCRERAKAKKEEYKAAPIEEEPASDDEPVDENQPEAITVDEALEGADERLTTLRANVAARREENVRRSRELKDYQQQARRNAANGSDNKKANCGYCHYELHDGHKLLVSRIDCPEHGTIAPPSRHTAHLGELNPASGVG